VWTFLKIQAPFATLLAPAAKLGGGETTILRALVLDQSSAILQDRPVIPVHLLGQPRWATSTLANPPAGAFGPNASPTLAVRRTPFEGGLR